MSVSTFLPAPMPILSLVSNPSPLNFLLPACWELKTAELLSHSSVGEVLGSKEGAAARSVAPCPNVEVSIGEAMVAFLVDTSSMVSTVTESFFLENFTPWGYDRFHSCHWLRLAIPYISYLELDVERCGKVMPRCGILVVKDPPGAMMTTTEILGMSVIRHCYRELFGAFGSSLFNSPSVSQAPSPVIAALQRYHQAATGVEAKNSTGAVRGRDKSHSGAMKFVASPCSGQFSGQCILFERPKAGLHAGLLASPCLVQVIQGTVYIPMVNVGTTEVLLYPRTGLGTLGVDQVISLPAGVMEETMVAAVSFLTATPSVLAMVEALNLSALTEQEQTRVTSLLHKYYSVFSAHDGDLGCAHLLSHDIPLLNEMPVRQKFQHIPSSNYGVVKTHIHQLLESHPGEMHP